MAVRMANFLLWMTVSFVFMRACIQAEVTFQNCGTPSDHVAELDLENISETELTCIGIGAEENVQWGLLNKNDMPRPAGLCQPPPNGSECSGNLLYSIMTPSRTSASESTMRIHHGGGYQRSLVNAALTCKEEEAGESGSVAKCPIDFIKPADGKCKAEVDTTSDVWRVHVHCNVTSGNSTMNRYKCILRQNQNEIKEMKMTQNNLPEGSAVCDIWVRLNTSVTGGHNYEVQFIPGRKVVPVEWDITIERPNEPEITNCRPEGMVRENQTVTCDCRTDRTGKPEGHLRWSVKVAEKENTFHILKDGVKGGKSLPLTTRRLTRSNHTNKLRCGVQWGKEFIRDSYQVTVGFPASRVEMSITPPNLEEGERQVIFECRAEDGRPSPEVELSRKGADRLKSSQTPLRHEIHARCEDSGDYTCRASNGMGPDQTVTNQLNVTCKPRDISGHIPPILYQDKEERFTFELVANPPPSKVTFGFLGSSGSNATSKVKDIFLSGKCGRKGASLTRVTCNVIVSNVTSWKAGGVYRGSVVNEKGRLDFDFVVKLNATAVESSSNIGLVAGAAAGAVVAIAIIIVIAFVLIRRGSRETKAFLHNGDDRDEGHVYGNINMQNAENNQLQDAGALDADGGAEYNQDGLLYVSMDFANKGPTPRPAPPEEDGVLYSAINFNRTAPSE